MLIMEAASKSSMSVKPRSGFRVRGSEFRVDFFSVPCTLYPVPLFLLIIPVLRICNQRNLPCAIGTNNRHGQFIETFLRGRCGPPCPMIILEFPFEVTARASRGDPALFDHSLFDLRHLFF